MESFARWVSSREYRAGLAAAGLSLVPLLSFLSGGVLVLMRLQKGALAGWRSGALAAGVIQRSPLGYLKTLATRYRAGDMSLRYAIESLL